MNAIVLAGGKGTRLAPLTTLVPKPLLTVAGYPMLDYVTSQLAYYGINNIVYAVAYKKEQIQARADGYKKIHRHKDWNRCYWYQISAPSKTMQDGTSARKWNHSGSVPNRLPCPYKAILPPRDSVSARSPLRIAQSNRSSFHKRYR